MKKGETIIRNKKLIVYNHRKVRQIFTASSKEEIWEVFHDSDKNKISLIKFKNFPKYFDQESAIDMNKREFMELLRFLKTIKLGKNKSVNAKWMSKALYETQNKNK